jgi:hypothetical protein
MRQLPLLACVAALATSSVVLAQASEPPVFERCIRLVEQDRASKLHLEVAVRRFSREGAPDIHLAGAIHIGERAFYEALQRRLDALDVVLFESVKPPGTGRPDHDVGPLDDEVRAAITKGRIRFLASAMHRYHALRGEWPTALAELAPGLPADLSALVANALVDAWDRPLVLAAAPARSRRAFDVQSLGADGTIGGSGADADLCFADQAPLSDAELGEGGGIQTDLAEALGLEFQLAVMDHTGSNWRNSDLAMDQVEARLANAGLDGEDLFSTIVGTSWVQKAAGFTLKLLSSFSYGNAALKLMGIEILARADEMLEHAPAELGDLLDVLLIERNSVVLEDLADILANEKTVRSIGVIYGAGHMRDLQERIVRDLGYELAGEDWLRAVSVDIDDLGIDPTRARMMRRMISDGIDGGLGGR